MRWCAAYAFAALALAGCSQRVVPATTAGPVAATDSLAATLFLIGDAGEPDPAGEPVLAALTAALALAPARSMALFLGDNVYPSGIPDSSAPGYAEARRRLAAQVGAVVASGARGVFIPGNHDWKQAGAGGWQAVLRAQEIVAQEGRGLVVQLPVDACPGPAVADLGPMRIVLLDTEWFLHGGPRPEGEVDGCASDTPAVLDSLRALLANGAGRTTLVAGHHPLVSGGEHAGYFGWKDYFFPLTEAKSWLWLPLPIIGVAYPAARNQGISRQDMSNSHYRAMIDSLEAAFEAVPPAAYVSGHEHGLQVIEMAPGRYQLISGSGYYGHVDFVGPVDGTRVALRKSGFMRLDLTLDGRLRLGVVTIDRDGRATEAASLWLVASSR